MALKVDITGSTHTIKVKTGVTEIDVREDIYSAAKFEWLNEVNNLHKYEFPYVVIGGDPIGGGQISPIYFFLKDPWKIETNGDGVLHNFTLNQYALDENGLIRDPFRVLSGDSITNKVSDIPGADLLQVINSSISFILDRLWTDDEKSQIRDALGVDGTKIESTGGKLQKTLKMAKLAAILSA